MREQSDGLYRVITYLVFKVLEEVVLAVASSVVYSLMVFYLVRLQGSFFPVWIVFLVTQLVGVGELQCRCLDVPACDVLIKDVTSWYCCCL